MAHSLDSLRSDLVDIVRTRLTPIALKYGYSRVPLEDKIKWKPVVLILGNYSSGKSTLINELLGMDLQKTGQAPTDDSFTVITHQEASGAVEERDGMVLLNDPQYPFAHLKKQGQRFASHFRLKKVRAPILENVAIIDTPGMLDSVAEKDRGYDYQEVVAELASIADLILILFDPHKAGTVRETYESLRLTLPKATSEDRILFVLNRIDECTNLHDFLRVYGTLCWNLSQMTGRKDIPPIYLTHSEHRDLNQRDRPAFLDQLRNQREDIQQAIRNAPRYRLDHLSTYIESHSERLGHFLEALQEYGRMRRNLSLKVIMIGAAVALLTGTVMYGILWQSGIITDSGADMALILASVVGASIMGLTLLWFYPRILNRFHESSLASLPLLTRLEQQNRQESWDQVEAPLRQYLIDSKGRFSLYTVRSDARQIKRASEQIAKEARGRITQQPVYE
ncbi:MAG TPA: dynamin family protein [Oligoflexus sp.]|uniref:dynamin family protein n=1 Tax=Oligoflexus sp. TaxID=1971216 RepID=UPI002D60D2CB|nr:dynamin family protein [Oligoflexus sp.]HYX33511.1 dynamin family protein [Oligoflexus sp.]